MTEYIEKRLFELQDSGYRDFQAKLMPNVSKDRIIGVRTPLLRSFAKELVKNEKIDEFLEDIPHKYYDENNLHGFIITECKDYEKTVKYVDALLPFVDNWATCDLLSHKVFKKHKKELENDIERWISSKETYTIRFGIEMIMSHYLDTDFDKKWLNRVAKIRSKEYYVNMMISWFFATALTKQWQATIPFIENRKLDKWCHNKSIQKANESYRITDTQKEYLKSLKIV